MPEKIWSVIWSLDTFVGLVIGLGVWIITPSSIPFEFSENILSVGISVLSIIFSIFFASLTFIISSSNDNFVEYLYNHGHYNIIIWSYQWTLGSLLIALVYSISYYSYASYWVTKPSSPEHGTVPFAIFCLLFAYSMTATVMSTKDAITYARMRARFLKVESKATEGGGASDS
jgi:hypothetical protein